MVSGMIGNSLLIPLTGFGNHLHRIQHRFGVSIPGLLSYFPIIPDYLVANEKVVFWELLDTLEASYEFVLAVKEQIKQRVHELVQEVG